MSLTMADLAYQNFALPETPVDHARDEAAKPGVRLMGAVKQRFPRLAEVHSKPRMQPIRRTSKDFFLMG
jgi:hypothetical protein